MSNELKHCIEYETHIECSAEPIIKDIILDKNVSIPQLGLGTWKLRGRECTNAIKEAIKLGYRHIDTAEIYGNHSEIGKAIKNSNRSNLFITSKVWHSNLGYHDTIASLNETLSEIETDYIDMFLIHFPNKNIPLSDTFQALKELKNEGSIKSIGVSNFTIEHLKEAIKIAKKLNLKIATNQTEFHPYLFQEELLNYANKNNIKIIAYSPLARTEIIGDNTLKKISLKYNKTETQIALRWLLEKGLIIIPKAKDINHMKSNMQIFNFHLTEEEIKNINSLNQNKRLVNPTFAEFE